MIKFLKKRYIAFKVTSKETKSRFETLNLFLPQLYTINQKHHTRIKLLEYKNDLGIGILRCDHKSVEIIRILFNLINTNTKENILFRIFGVSGTLKALRRKFLAKKNVTNNSYMRKSF